MSVAASVERINQLIAVSNQRLMPQALQRLSIEEILGDHAKRSRAEFPSAAEVGVPAILEPTYKSLVKFLDVHEPTGREKDMTQKRNAVRYLALVQMVQECQQIQLPNAQTACIKKLLEWFEETSTSGLSMHISPSTSVPVLPPRMSPKKPMSAAPMIERSSSESALPHGQVDAMTKASIAQKLKKYRMPNLRASHSRRVAQLRSRGGDLTDGDFTVPIDDENNDTFGELVDPTSYTRQAQHAKINATFNLYEPETEAEYAMHHMWLERQLVEKIEKVKAEEVQSRIQSWAMTKSREDSEYLRKRESMQLAAGLDRFCQEEYEAAHPHQIQLNQLEKKREEWQALQESAPTPVNTAMRVSANGISSSSNKETSRSSVRANSNSATVPSDGIVVVKKKRSAQNGSTPSTSGGMHFRNRLPQNYTPPSRRNGPGSSTPVSRDSGAATPSAPLSTSSADKLAILDKAAERAERQRRPHMNHSGIYDTSQYSDDSPDGEGDTESDAITQFDDRNAGKTHTMKAWGQSRDENPEFSLQPYYPATQTQRGSNTSYMNAIERKHFPRGTLPTETEPIDPEYRQMYRASQSRKPPLSKPSLTNDKIPGPSKTKYAAPTTNQQDPIGASKRLPTLTQGPGVVQGSTGTHPSELRTEQMQEMDRIRELFAQHNLSIPADVLAKGLLVPEDRSSLDCIHNLPFPGAGLVSHPMLQKKTKVLKKKKKKTKKKGKGGKTSGSKSPAKKRK